MDLDDIKKLRSITGKHVYNQEYEKDEKYFSFIVKTEFEFSLEVFLGI